MLTAATYTKGMAINSQLKYNINYDKSQLFDVICAGLASKLLTSEYAVDLTDEQRDALTKIANE